MTKSAAKELFQCRLYYRGRSQSEHGLLRFYDDSTYRDYGHDNYRRWEVRDGVVYIEDGPLLITPLVLDLAVEEIQITYHLYVQKLLNELIVT